MKILIWQWGRFGAGPRVTVDLAQAFRALPDTEVVLSLARDAEILRSDFPPQCELPFPTYAGLTGFVGRLLSLPVLLPALLRTLRRLQPDVALCGMPAPLDLVMRLALRRSGIPYALIVHDADAHPGDGFPLQMALQRRMMRGADALVALSGHVAQRIAAQGYAAGKPLLSASLPPIFLGTDTVPPRAHGGRLRLLSFGRLLPYKGLDLLAESLALLGPRADLEVRVVGSGPESAALAALRALPMVQVENRWVPEGEITALLAWADAVVLSHREASQSGVAAAAAAARRWVVATRVGGLVEQLRDDPLALLCDPDAASLAATLHRLLEAPPAIPEARRDLAGDWQRTAASLRRQLGEALLQPRRTRERVPQSLMPPDPAPAPIAQRPR